MKTTHNKSGYGIGAIVKISLKNFLTYDTLHVKLNPKLNVIIGPNGSGKSSIVCAICLVLGGKTSLLARAKDVGEYIKHGETTACVEIELYDEPKNVVIFREISKGSNNKVSSSWYLNGEVVNAKRVEEVVQRLNIQLFNLCQFLPQEKVTEFSKMNKLELLENTERAVCPPQMHKDHMFLKEFRSTETALQAKYDDQKKHLELLERKNQRVEQEVKRYKEREKYIEEIKLLEMKRAWKIFESAREDFVEKKDELKRFDILMKRETKQAQIIIKKQEAARKALEQSSQSVKDCGGELKNSANQAKNIITEINDISNEVKQKQDEFNQKSEDEKQRLKKIDLQKSQVSSWKAELENLIEINVQPQITKLGEEIERTLHQTMDVEQEQKRLQHEISMRKKHIQEFDSKIQKLNDICARRLETLRRRDGQLYQAVLWLRENQNLFSEKVHEPILLELSIRDPRAAEVIENHVAMRDMTAFVCQNANDNKRLIAELREKRKMRINSVRAPRDPNGNLIHPAAYAQNPINPLKQWGFTGYLKDLFDAPDAVLAFLCKQYNVHNLPLGTKKTLDKMEQIAQHGNLKIFFIPSADGGKTPGSRHTARKSKYSSNVITSNSTLRQPQFLSASADPSEIQELEAQKHELVTDNDRDKRKLDELAQQKKNLERIDNRLRQERQELIQKMSRKRMLENQIQLKQNSIRSLEEYSVDIDQLKKDLQESLGEIYSNKIVLAKQFIESINNCIDCNRQKAKLLVATFQHRTKILKIEAEMREQNSKQLQNGMIHERLKAESKEASVLAKSLLADARKTTNGDPTEELKQKFTELPEELNEIETKIHNLKTRAECSITNERIVEEYNTRKKEIERVRATVDSMEERLSKSRGEIEEVKKRWLGPLIDITNKINQRFSNFFKRLECAGEVGIDMNHPDEFDTYGIRIRVKFRSNSTLQDLDPFRQSGGERSVSTMLYLMALQSLHACPFRVVDEINQGMDPYNERRVFEVIAMTATEATSSQYFLITPKLLPNLSYNNHMTVHCIYNGESMVSHSDWKLSRFIRHRKRLCYEDED